MVPALEKKEKNISINYLISLQCLRKAKVGFFDKRSGLRIRMYSPKSTLRAFFVSSPPLLPSHFSVLQHLFDAFFFFRTFGLFADQQRRHTTDVNPLFSSFPRVVVCRSLLRLPLSSYKPCRSQCSFYIFRQASFRPEKTMDGTSSSCPSPLNISRHMPIQYKLFLRKPHTQT